MEDYFDPEGEISFLFPSCLSPSRFDLDAEDRLHFHGRESLKTLFDRVETFLLQKRERNFYYVGNIGAGKVSSTFPCLFGMGRAIEIDIVDDVDEGEEEGNTNNNNNNNMAY